MKRDARQEGLRWLELLNSHTGRRGGWTLLPLIPPTPFSHKGRRGRLDAVAPHPPQPFLPQGEKGEFGRPEAQNERRNAGASKKPPCKEWGILIP